MTSNFFNECELYTPSRDRTISAENMEERADTHSNFHACSSLAHPAHSGHSVVTLSYKLCFSSTVS